MLGDHAWVMKRNLFSASPALIVFFGALLSIVCADPPVAATPVPSPGRLLASTCFQCHSSSGFEGITGESPGELASELKEMRARQSPEGIMDLVARGLTDAQIADLAAYLATLPQTTNHD